MTRKKRLGRPDLPLLSVNLPVGVLIRPTDSGRQAPSEDLSGYQVVNEGDLVVNQLGKPHGALGVSNHSGIISPAYFVAEFDEKVEPRFMHHLLRTRLYISEYERRGKFMPPNQFDISWDEFRDIEIVLPPRSQQKMIADYLDNETARIDTLVNKKRYMIELLESKMECEALQLTQARGKVEALRRSLNRIQTGTTPNEEFFSLDDGCDSIPWITPGDFNARLSAASISKSLRVDAVTSGVIKIHPKDSVLLVGIGATAGRVSMADQSVTSNQQITGLVCSERLLPRFLAWQLWARRSEVLDTAPYTTLPILNNEFLKSLMIFVPSFEEQEAVATRLDRLASRVGMAKQGLDTQIARFIELRQTLITAAVTGELEIPEVAA
jgi:type I restriction enzyme S subunit